MQTSPNHTQELLTQQEESVHPLEQPAPPPQKKKSIPPLILIGIMIITAALIARARTLDSQLQQTQKKLAISPPVSLTPTATPTATPTPYPLPQGKQAYKISHGNSVGGPKVTDVSIDPFDPKVGETQTFTVVVSHKVPINSITLALQTDNKTTNIPLEKKSESNEESTWVSTFLTDDTHFYTYYAQFITKQNGTEFPTGLTFRAY